MGSVLEDSGYFMFSLPRGRQPPHRRELRRGRAQLQQLGRECQRQHRVLPPDGVLRKKTVA